MLGHGSLQMIFTTYYAWIPKETRNDGSAFMRAYHSMGLDGGDTMRRRVGSIIKAKNEPQMWPTNEKGVAGKTHNPLKSLVAGRGFEPLAFGL